MSYGIVRFTTRGAVRLGVLSGDTVADAAVALASLLGPQPEIQAVLDRWDEAEPLLGALADDMAAGSTADTWPLRDVRLLAPLPRPVNFYCAFSNYKDHTLEMGGTPADTSKEDPFLFLVPTTAVNDPGVAVIIPSGISRVDYEGELAAVIGRRARNLSEDDALSCVAGYTIIFDVSIRGGARRGDNGGRPDYHAAKGRATFKPMGPCIVPARFIPDPQVLQLRTWVNGDLRQNSNTGQMIFSTAQQISHLSRLTGVVPGEIVATGTPAGVGLPKSAFLKPGDTVEIEIEGIGRLTTPIAGG